MTAPSIISSESSLASDSTISTASRVPATTRSRSDFFMLLDRRVEHKLALDDADAGGADRAHERNARQGQRGRGGDQRDDVGIVLEVVGEHGGDDLRLVLEALDEQRPDRPVDEARDQRLLLGRAALALEIAARDLAGGIGLLLVVDGQREEIDPRPSASSRATTVASTVRLAVACRARRRRPGGQCGRSRDAARGRPTRFLQHKYRTSSFPAFCPWPPGIRLCLKWLRHPRLARFGTGPIARCRHRGECGVRPTPPVTIRQRRIPRRSISV